MARAKTAKLRPPIVSFVGLLKKTLEFPLPYMGSFSVRQFIAEYQGHKLLGKYQISFGEGFRRYFKNKTEESVASSWLYIYHSEIPLRFLEMNEGLEDLRMEFGASVLEMRIACIAALFRRPELALRRALDVSGNLNVFLVQDVQAQTRAVIIRFGGGYCLIDAVSLDDHDRYANARIFRRKL